MRVPRAVATSTATIVIVLEIVQKMATLTRTIMKVAATRAISITMLKMMTITMMITMRVPTMMRMLIT